MKKIMMAFLLLSISSFSIYAQSSIGNKLHFELEPLQFINNGWSVVGHYSINERFQIGTNIFSQVLPESSNDFAFDITNEIDLLSEQDFGLNVSLRYFFKSNTYQSGWVMSLPLGWETWTLTDTETNTDQEYAFWYLSPRIGYLWYPFKKKRIYLLGELIGIIPISTDSDVQFGETGVSIKPFIPLPSIGVGIAF